MNTTAKLRLIPTAVTINVPHLDGVHRPMPAYMDNQGKLYHLVTCSGVLLAWTTQPDDDMVPCVIVEALDETPPAAPCVTTAKRHAEINFEVMGTAADRLANPYLSGSADWVEYRETLVALLQAAQQETPCVTLKRILVKEWFQRTMGSTYHTVTFEMTNGNTFKTPRAYGYGDQYKTYAADLAERHAVALPRDPNGCILWHELNVAIVSVKARKDL